MAALQAKTDPDCSRQHSHRRPQHGSEATLSPAVIKEGDRTAFIAGKAAMQHYHAQWYSYKEMSVDFTVPVWHILYPGAGKVPVHFAESHPWCMSPSSKLKEEGWTWMKYIYLSLWLPARRGREPLLDHSRQNTK
jgi:hypothetical protein